MSATTIQEGLLGITTGLQIKSHLRFSGVTIVWTPGNVPNEGRCLDGTIKLIQRCRQQCLHKTKPSTTTGTNPMPMPMNMNDTVLPTEDVEDESVVGVVVVVIAGTTEEVAGPVLRLVEVDCDRVVVDDVVVTVLTVVVVVVVLMVQGSQVLHSVPAGAIFSEAIVQTLFSFEQDIADSGSKYDHFSAPASLNTPQMRMFGGLNPTHTDVARATVSSKKEGGNVKKKERRQRKH
jgi:hypothetical protein